MIEVFILPLFVFHPPCVLISYQAVCNFLFLIFNSIFNILLCAIATFPHYVKRKIDQNNNKKSREGVAAFHSML